MDNCFSLIYQILLGSERTEQDLDILSTIFFLLSKLKYDIFTFDIYKLIFELLNSIKDTQDKFEIIV